MFIKRFLFVASIIFVWLFGISFLFDDSYDNEQLFLNYDYRIEKNLRMIIANKKVKDNILFTLYIPRINLEKDVYTIGSSENNVDYNIEILEGSDISKNLLFLASHSGFGNASYFNELVQLEMGDIIWIDKGNEKIYFMVKDIFYIPKKGYFECFFLENRLYLITCSLDYLDKQLVVESVLIK